MLPSSQKQAVTSLLIGGFLPLISLLLLTWLSVKHNLHVLRSDSIFWIAYTLIALPLFWFGMGFWCKKPVLRFFISLGLLLGWAVLLIVGVFSFHVAIGGKL